MNGWIKLHRKLLNNPIFNNDKLLKVWIWCLLKSQHEKKEVYVGQQKIALTQGQFIYGRRTASGQLKMPPSTIRNCISILKQDSYLDIKTTNKYSVITVLNWNRYQAEGQQKGQQKDSRRTAEGQQKDSKKDTYKKNIIKNDKNISNKKKGVVKGKRKRKGLKDITQDDIEKIMKDYQVPESFVLSKIDDIKNYCASKGKVYRDYLATLRNWVKKDAIKLRKEAKSGTERIRFIDPI